MNLLIETTTGQPVPAGSAPAFLNAPQQVVLGFSTGGVIGPVAGGAITIALALFAPGNLSAPLATFSSWGIDESGNYYVAEIDPTTVSALAWMKIPATLFAQISYGASGVQSQKFLVNFGGSGTGTASPRPPTFILQTAGAGIYPQDIGRFAGDVATGQVEGYFKVKAAATLLGFQLHAQNAPVGAAVQVDVVKNGVNQNTLSTLAAGSKSQETIFPTGIPLAVGDVVQFTVTQIGSTAPGSELNVMAILQAA